MVSFGGGVGPTGSTEVVDVYDTGTGTWSTLSLQLGRSPTPTSRAGRGPCLPTRR
ncbi:MAG: hypothetical protein GY711_25070 [bacterium]|nr:hypothetical protein [bacterium]